MKYLVIFILGFVAGAYIVRYKLPDWESPSQPTQGNAAPTHDSLEDKLRRWHLAPADIKNDIARTGEVVRTQAGRVGDKISDVSILTVIKAKYVLDRDLSASSIKVEVHDGRVTLDGTVQSNELLGRAVALALDTEGVTNVTARLTAPQ
jgi:hypothetical protein